MVSFARPVHMNMRACECCSLHSHMGKGDRICYCAIAQLQTQTMCLDGRREAPCRCCSLADPGHCLSLCKALPALSPLSTMCPAMLLPGTPAGARHPRSPVHNIASNTHTPGTEYFRGSRFQLQIPTGRLSLVWPKTCPVVHLTSTSSPPIPRQ